MRGGSIRSYGSDYDSKGAPFGRTGVTDSRGAPFGRTGVTKIPGGFIRSYGSGYDSRGLHSVVREWLRFQGAPFGRTGVATIPGGSIRSYGSDYDSRGLHSVVREWLRFQGAPFGRTEVATIPGGSIRALYRFVIVNATLWWWEKKGYTVPQVFTQVAKRHPEKVAFYYEKHKWTFAQEHIKSVTDKVCSLLNLGTCGLHVVQGSLRTRVEPVNWDIGSVLRHTYYLFTDSTARRALFTQLTGCTTFLQKFCGELSSLIGTRLIYDDYAYQHLISLRQVLSATETTRSANAAPFRLLPHPTNTTKFRFLHPHPPTLAHVSAAS
uniref:Uncharacterized protein n=1 Tax=Timema tahoe TaxID=61484 RepID=A0A7R9NWY6_9NEOP|nr:unnamed protein product [Timema tahoe]